VLDENGEPLSRMTVQARVENYNRKGRHLTVMGQATTDDRGQYRIFDLAAGRYYVSAVIATSYITPRGHLRSDQIETAYVATWFPGVTESLQAAPNVLAAGAELNLDIRMRKVPVFHIRGQAPAVGNWLAVESCDTLGSNSQTAPILRDGTFEAAGVPRGVWCLSMNQMTDSTNGLFGRATVTVSDHDVNGVTLPVLPTASVKVQVLVDGAVPTKFSGSVRLEPLEPGRSTGGGVQQDGAFVIPNVPPDTFRVVLNSMGGYVKAIRLNGQETAGDRVTIPQGGGQLTVLANTDTGQISGATEPPGLMITAVPAAGDAESVFAFSAPDGSFTMRAVPPGTYQLFAWETREQGLLEYPEFRKQFQTRGVTVTLPSKGQETVKLKGISAAEIEEAKGRLR
jgi:hypothetical protein